MKRHYTISPVNSYVAFRSGISAQEAPHLLGWNQRVRYAHPLECFVSLLCNSPAPKKPPKSIQPTISGNEKCCFRKRDYW